MSVQSYCGCSYCCIHFDEGPGCAIYSLPRRWLAPDDPLRSVNAEVDGHRYCFRNREERGQPPEKTTQSVFKNSHIARVRDLLHFLGQKGRPMLSSLRGFNYERFNLLEWMHNMARAYDNILELLVGNLDGSADRKARKTSRALGLFPAIWAQQQQYLSALRTTALAGLQDGTITRADAAWCRRWLRLCTIIPATGARVRELRELVRNLRDTAANGERIPLTNVLAPLPWRLSAEAQEIVNKRVAGIIYSHYTPVCGLDDETFIKRTGCWRTASKLIALCVILVPALRDYVPAFRAGLRKLILGLRILEGQTYSVNEARALNVGPGKSIKKTDIARAHRLIIRGLSMIEGSCPVACLKPAIHCLCHYGAGTQQHGMLRLLWMMSFERFNKKCKNLTANKRLPYESLAISLVRDATASFHQWSSGVVETDSTFATASVCIFAFVPLNQVFFNTTTNGNSASVQPSRFRVLLQQSGSMTK